MWSDLISNMGGIGVILQYCDCHPNFKAFCIELFQPIGNKLGWDPVEGEGRCRKILHFSLYVKNYKNDHRKILLSSFNLNGRALGFY